MSKSGKATRQNVRVICRVRPTNQREIKEGGVTCVKYTEDTIEVNNEGSNKFNFDRIFGSESTQIDVFTETAAPLIEDVLAGYNATIFAYGQTGTGKTHTMEGDIHSAENKGIIPRAVDALFDGVTEADENIEFTFQVSYVEIYLEKIRDLLDEHRTKTNLTVREDKLKGVYIAGVTEEYVTSSEELLHIMHVGAHNRATAATGMNEGSSRSHSVFTITVTQKDVRTNAMKSGKLQLVDLAGSEMVRKTGASGQQLEEAKMINKSLSALGQVINALTDEKATHVPYRDSKLTRVLQDSLGGNSKTVLIIAVSPSSFNAAETVSTMRFGMRAKSIENKVKINATRSVEELEALLVRAENAIDAQSTYIMALTARIEALQGQLQQGHPAPGVAAAPSAAEGEENEGQVMPANAIVLEEGKVVVDQSRLDAEAAAIQKLQEDVFRLTQELEDEKNDSQRKDGEILGLNRLLKEKERFAQEASAAVSELQRQNESLGQRVEVLLKEKIEVVGELESVKASLSESTSKVYYQMQEMEVTLQTVQAENLVLKQEVAELAGNGGSGHPGKKNLINSDGVDEPVVTPNPRNVSRGVTRGVTGGRSSYDPSSDPDMLSATGSGSNSGKVHVDRKHLLEQMSDQFATVCLKHTIDDQASAELFAVMDNYAMEAERSFALAEEKYVTMEKTQVKRIKDLDDQRHRLEKDLQNRIENMIQLQMRFDALGRMDSKSQESVLQDRDRAKQKSLQQRLEQLVAVHRQLLRKFATLELENGELKKKTQLREDRIKQLEDNSRTLVNNVRVQAEKHLAEVTIFREQIQIMKIEFEKQYEMNRLQESELQNSNNGMNNNLAHHNTRSPGNNIVTRNTLMNRNLQPKSIRGGGVGGRSFYQANEEGGNPHNLYPASPTSASLLQRYQSFGFGGSMTAAGNAPTVAAGAVSPPQAPAVEEPRSMGLAARLLGQHK